MSEDSHLGPTLKIPRASYMWAQEAGFPLGERERIDQWIDWHLLRLIVEREGETVTPPELFERLLDAIGEGVTCMRILNEVFNARERLRELGWVERVPAPVNELGDLGDRPTAAGVQIAQQPNPSDLTVERIVEVFALEDREDIWRSAAKLCEDVKSYTFVESGKERFLDSRLSEFHTRFDGIARDITALPPHLTERERSALARLGRLNRITPDDYRNVLLDVAGETRRGEAADAPTDSPRTQNEYRSADWLHYNVGIRPERLSELAANTVSTMPAPHGYTDHEGNRPRILYHVDEVKRAYKPRRIKRKRA